jgi:hypothetical protein
MSNVTPSAFSKPVCDVSHATPLHLLAVPASEPLPALEPLTLTAALLGVYSDAESAARCDSRARQVALPAAGKQRRAARRSSAQRQLRAEQHRAEPRRALLRRRSDPTKGVHALRAYLRVPNPRLFARRKNRP